MKVELKNVSKRLNDVTVLEDISLTLEAGTIYGLKGKNGCGKTMLMRMMAGVIYPTSGTVSIDGEILHKDIATPRSIGVLIENPVFLPGYTGQRNLELLAGLTGKADRTQIAKTMNRVGLDPSDKRTYRKYSLGMKQRLGIACALMECPDLILLDEPINAIDEKGVPKIWEALQEEKQRGALIVLACHDTEELTSLADQIITIEEGKICGISSRIERNS
ncbi:ABC transporter ATP-binding protein [Gemmiger formicilis]|jgi:ABC-2 type transport system ATP-binding protein|uniref:ABC transporter ATP-binding protein n=1 Tax=Gemmiger formicilis TaxID=745368 RepID=UPI001EC6F843|nr:ABC transporter ATP-binding protein [Gemmiger formicilis]MBS6539747.1 ABC transporter ATP-binding protein [Subdoligranulum variabile]